jgi:hypothetical protein
MRIVRQSDSAIVVRDSTLWVFAVCTGAALFAASFAFTHGDRRSLIAAACILLFAVVWLRRSTFTFDRASQSVRWRRFRTGKTETGTIPFAEVRDICVESTTSGQANVICRLTIQTATGTTPMADAYSANSRHAAALRTTLLRFIHAGEAAGPAAAANADDDRTRQLNNSIRSLLAQGRKIDAILLVRQTDHLDLTEATYRVNQVASQMDAKQPSTRV